MSTNPFVSILLPIRNESAYIEHVLLSIAQQDYPFSQVEMLVVDGLSTDNTLNIVMEFSALNPQLKIRILDNPSKIVSTGLNIALRQAKGEVIIRVDGHCIIAPDYVRKCVEHIQKDGPDGVGGSIESLGETQMAKTIAIGMSSLFGVGNSAFRTLPGKTLWTDSVPFPAYTRKIIERAGLYDEELVRNQDDEYNYRIRSLGGRILLAEDIHSIYFSRTSLKSLWRQYFQYGYWKVRILQKHSRQMSLRQFIPPAFILALFGSVLIVMFPIFSPFSMIIPLLYVIANLLASLWTTSKHGWKYIGLLPLIFAILHLSYGLGFLIGLVKFWNRWADKIGRVPVWTGQIDG